MTWGVFYRFSFCLTFLSPFILSVCDKVKAKVQKKNEHEQHNACSDKSVIVKSLGVAHFDYDIACEGTDAVQEGVWNDSGVSCYMMTAIVSPIALPTARITLASMPDFAAGKTTVATALSCVAPRATAPS